MRCGHYGEDMRALKLTLCLMVLGAACTAAPRPELVDPFGDAGKSADGPTLTTAPALETTLQATAVTSIVASAVVETVEVFTEPDESAERIHELDNPIPSGGPLVFLVEESTTDWLHVLLPLRPNGSLGWIRATDVELTSHRYRIEVSLSDFDLKVFNGDQLAFQTAVAVAAENAPTPGGQYYITELLAPEVPDTIYGDFAYGLSGFSETFETFGGGPGQLGIHGTNDPDRIGSGVSSGCVRLANGDIAALVGFLPLGTPVAVIG